VKLAPTLRAIIGADPSFIPQTSGSGLSSSSSLGPGQAGGQPGLTVGTQGGSPGVSAIASQASAGGTGAGGAGGLAGMIQADPATNSLIVTAPEPLYRNIRAIVDKLDVRRAQVVIESLIVEVTADKAAEFGIQWQALGGIDDSGTNVIGGTNFGGAGQNIIGAAQNIGSLGPGLNLGVIRGRVNIPGVGEVLNLAFLARALATTADANILSTPTIQTLDNEEAKFLVGQNIPLITGSFAQGGVSAAGVNPFQTFERRDIGLQLRVKPQISQGGVVRLAIYQELSSIQNTLTAAQGGIITNKRSFESTVLVENGNIVVLGGLIEDRTDNSRSQVPVLGDIPGVGALFRYENRGRRKTNLLVFLRPYVVPDEATSSSLALDRYDYIRGQVAAGTLPDTLVFRDLQGRQLPPTPPVPPTMRKPEGAAPTTGTIGPAGPEPTRPAPDAGAVRTDPPAPIIDIPPAAPPAPASAPASAAPPSAPAVVETTPVPAPQIAAEPKPVAPMPAPPPSAVAPPSAPPPAPVTPPATAMPRTEPPAPPTSPPVVAAPAPAPATPITSPAAPPDARTAPPPASVSPPVAAAPAPSVAGAAAPSAAASTASRPGGSTLLQVAAVNDIARGRELQRQLRAAGMDAYWESVSSKGKDIVRVRVTVDPAVQSMADAIARLKAMGFDPIIVTP
jgi:general secretion pathway protein D